MDIKERLIEYIRLNKIPTAKFERSCGLSNGYVKSIKKNPGIEKIDNILRNYPDINREWLLTGHGDMTYNSAVENEKTEMWCKENHLENSEISILKNRLTELKKEISILKDERHTLINSNSRLSMMLQEILSKTIKTTE